MAPLRLSYYAVALFAAACSTDVASARYLQGNRFGRVVVEEEPSSSAVDSEVDASSSDEYYAGYADEEHGEDVPPPPPEDPPAEKKIGSLIDQQFSPDPHADRDHLQMIRDGELGLAGIRFVPDSFSEKRTEGETYDEVWGEFCAYDIASSNRADPARFPTASHVMDDSEHCGEHRYRIPLREAVGAIIEDGGIRSLSPPSGMLFHQGYSGAGAISNALAAFDSTLVVSEHPALRDALSACDVVRNRYLSTDCSLAKQRALVRDVISLLGRTRDESATRMFLKLHSHDAAYLPDLVDLYPMAKWTFSYRDAEESLGKTMMRKRSQYCVKAGRNPSGALLEKSADHGWDDMDGFTRHEICALHMSTLLEAAFEEHESTGAGMLVSYDDVLSSGGSVILEDVLSYLGLRPEVESDPDLAARVTEVLSTRSNAGMSHPHGKGREWDRSEEEGLEISDEVRDAVRKFMAEIMRDAKR